MKNKVFITGLTGMVGSHLAEFLLKKQTLKFMVYVDGILSLTIFFILTNT